MEMITIKKKEIKQLIISIAIPLIIGVIGTLIGNPKMGFEMINKPSFMPPRILFPIVWTILYIVMGISSYLIYKEKKEKNNKALKAYGLQLILNMLWTYFFFNIKAYLFSLIWLLILLIVVIIMVIKFIKINKTAGLIQIPYIIWLVFAATLNFAIFQIN